MKNSIRQFHALILALALLAALTLAAKIGAEAGPAAGALLGLAAFASVSAILARREAACFANNFGVLTNTILVHDAFSLFLTGLFPLRDLVLDVGMDGDRAVKPGQTITVKDWRTNVTPYLATTAGGGYNQPSNVVLGPDTTATMPNAPWAVSIVLTAEEYRVLASGATGGTDYQTFRDKLRDIMGLGLGRLIISQWFSLITAANFPNAFITAPGTFSRGTEIDLDTKFFGRNVSPVGTNGILPGATYGEWVKDHIAIQTYTGENRQKTVLLGGRRESDNSNFTLWRTNVPMPADAARGFVCAKSHAIGAFRIPDEPTFENDPVSLNEVVDAGTPQAPGTGITMLNRLWKNSQTGQIQMDLAVIFTFIKGQPEALERLVAA